MKTMIEEIVKHIEEKYLSPDWFVDLPWQTQVRAAFALGILSTVKPVCSAYEWSPAVCVYAVATAVETVAELLTQIDRRYAAETLRAEVKARVDSSQAQ